VYGRTSRLLNLPPGTASKAVAVLLGSGWLVEERGQLQIVDPLFADWIRRRFPVPS
jgi:hypothetical protein